MTVGKNPSDFRGALSDIKTHQTLGKGDNRALLGQKELSFYVVKSVYTSPWQTVAILRSKNIILLCL